MWLRAIAVAVGAVVATVGLAAVALFGLGAREAAPEGPPVEITIPTGAIFRDVVDTLGTYGVVNRPGLFSIYARIKGADREIRAGEYAFSQPSPWFRVIRDLTEGRVLTENLIIPEGFTLSQMAPRIAAIAGLEADSVLAELKNPSLALEFGVPGPTLEGYLFPDTYRFALGVPLRDILATMVARYEEVWTPERVAEREEIDLSEAEVITLASIVQAEARLQEEMPTIASVYHNRLEQGQLLQADPTVLYALGGPRARLLYAAMDSVADNPYNTYTHAGLPPGPIGAPGITAIDATLHPADSDFFYFVAHPDGTHVFSRTLAQHNQAVAETRREWDRLRRESQEGQGSQESQGSRESQAGQGGQEGWGRGT